MPRGDFDRFRVRVSVVLLAGGLFIGFPAAAGAEEEPGSAVAPTPGTVIAVHVEVGQAVEKGAKLVVLEAMKMEHAVVAGEAGTVAEVRVEVGDAVDEGALLVRIESDVGDED